MANFFRFENRTTISAVLEMETPISIGSRAAPLPAGSDLPVIKTPEGIPFIPGSSLKGVIRAHTERLLRTLDAIGKKHEGERLWACDPLDEKNRCVIARCCENCEGCRGNCCNACRRCKSCMVKRHQRNGFLDDEKFTAELWSQSCTACRLFGSQWLASRVAFQDAMLSNDNELLRLTEVRDGVGIDRDLGSARKRIKYDYEVVPAGARFDVRIVVENAEEWEIGLLLLSLKAMEQGELPIGGKTTRGLGWGKLTDLKIQRVDKSTLLTYLQGGNAQTFEPNRFIDAFVKLLK